MDKIIVTGNGPLHGQVQISGAKNACLTLMPVALMTEEPVVLSNAPRLSDITTASDLLRSLGVDVDTSEDGREIALCARGEVKHFAEYDIVRKMRASNLVLGPLLARTGRAVVSLPGGCAIGTRPMDLHIHGLEKMGARIEVDAGYLHATAPSGGLVGAEIDLPVASVGATENLMMAATLAKGTTVINNAAREPEVMDLAKCLRSMGAHIDGDGSSRLTIEGVQKLSGVRHTIIVDRIELGTYMLAPAIAGGNVECLGGRLDLLSAFAEKLDETGISVEETAQGVRVRRTSQQLKAIDITTAPYPGFPTDLQAQMMTFLCTVDGLSIINEKIFENRFMHVPELNRLGANLVIEGGTVLIHGISNFKGAKVMATDLRASASLILAGLVAEGETHVSRVYHVDRGYEHIVRKLSGIGANIKRIK